MPFASSSAPLGERLGELRRRADGDALAPLEMREAGRHSEEIAELGLRVSVTRARYPNTPGGVDQYAVTISRLALDHEPAEAEVWTVLAAAFGEELVDAAVERPSGPLVRMFRLPAGS